MVLFATTVAQAAPTIGGHLGIAVPIATVADEVSVVGGDFVNLGITPGITVKLDEKWSFDFEFIAMNRFKDAGQTTTFVVDPGLVRSFGSYAIGGRIATEVGAPTNIGLVPIFVLPDAEVAPGVKYFVELDIPLFLRANGNGRMQSSISALFQTGVGF